MHPKAVSNILAVHDKKRTNIRLTAIFRDYPGEPVPER